MPLIWKIANLWFPCSNFKFPWAIFSLILVQCFFYHNAQVNSISLYANHPCFIFVFFHVTTCGFECYWRHYIMYHCRNAKNESWIFKLCILVHYLSIKKLVTKFYKCLTLFSLTMEVSHLSEPWVTTHLNRAPEFTHSF